MTIATYYRGPREKLQENGASSLTTRELLQVVIGSGNSHVGVSRIARKTLQLLTRHGSEVSYEQLEGVSGLGPAKICQIIALFELAGRYPSTARQLTINTDAKIIAQFRAIRSSPKEVLIVTTLDGGFRHIARRILPIKSQQVSDIIRQIFIGAVGDRATKLIVGIGSRDRSLEPSLFDLSLVRDVRATASLFSITILAVYFVNAQLEKKVRVVA